MVVWGGGFTVTQGGDDLRWQRERGGIFTGAPGGGGGEEFTVTKKEEDLQ